MGAAWTTLNLVVEIKGYRGEDAKEKKSTMDAYWIPAVNNLLVSSAAGPSPSSPTCMRSTDFTARTRPKPNKMIAAAEGA